MTDPEHPGNFAGRLHGAMAERIPGRSVRGSPAVSLLLPCRIHPVV